MREELLSIIEKYSVKPLEETEELSKKGNSYQKVSAFCPQCDQGFETTLYSIISSKRKCPYCNNRTLLQGFNDLASKEPEISKEWNNERNHDTPNNNLSSSNKKVWWKCEKHGHEWEATISQRTKQKQNCPYCSNRRLLKGFNDLATRYPELQKYWSKNNSTTMDNEIGGTKEFLWICSTNEKHEYSATIYKQNDYKTCPVCHGKKAVSGDNSAYDHFSQKLKNEWDYEKNEKEPTKYTKGSNYKAYWICEKEQHSFQSVIYNRIKRGDGCPYCSNKKLITGFNDLKTVYPQLAKEWNNKRNNELNPTQILCGSSKKIWWKCSNGHEWNTSISLRVSQGTQCPKCR